MLPLLFTSLGILVALRAGQFNTDGEGQIYLGALGSALIGLYVQGIPAVIHIPLALVAGFLFDVLWGWIPGYLKAVRGVNEAITTLLPNYIAVNLVSYLVQNPLKATGAPSPYSPLIAKERILAFYFTPKFSTCRHNTCVNASRFLVDIISAIASRIPNRRRWF